jgi:pSer/pThr/pTyr-binding forkhead associated (FHA) protein
MAILTLVFGRDVLGTHEVDGEKLVMGRAEDCDITIDNLAVSRHHAIIEKIEGAYAISDLDSNNGTFVNGRRIDGHTTLNFGDEIGIGKHILVFDSHSKKARPVQASLAVAAASAQPDMDAGGRGTMFVEPEQMVKIQEKGATARKAHLQIVGSPNGQLIALEKSDIVFGKASSCDIVVGGFFTARRHAILSHLEQGVQLTNLATLLPTQVNDNVIDSALLVDGDEIKIGKTRFIFRSGQ